ncbi:cyclin-D3-1-like [Phalaenopsis equestris]|uniref:cyclin-D3-1-like n=1 Tax=Phalaenopsis equestris TaxID=78828 RepID=UPI0009E5F5B7|nr:cyclin-D3-1-like [Phalaenopsis equestris]
MIIDSIEEKRVKSHHCRAHSTMGVVYDYASSILLCPEDKRSILCIEEDFNGDAQGCFSAEISDQKVVFFPLQTEECLNALLGKESEHLPAADYAERLMSGVLDISARKDAVEWIQKAIAYYSFGPVTAYLSVNYLDRFLSTHELPQGKAWMMQLLAVTCLSIAIKMEENEVPLVMDLQICNAKYVFEAKTIQKMELLMLSNLKWRMKSVTPFSFIDYFLHKFHSGSAPKEPEISLCKDLILCTVKGIGFLKFRPSEVAAAAVLAALVDDGLVSMDKALKCCSFLDKEKVIQCYKALQGTKLMEKKLLPASSVPQSPNGVLDAATLSYNSDETISSSQEKSLNNSPTSKKRKLNNTSAS